MPNSQLTQCPHCKASFKVTEEQLNAANGRVRCGACLNIFDAIAYQISAQAPSSSPKQAHQKDIMDDELDLNFDEQVDNEIISRDKQSIDDDDQFFADDPEEDKQEKGYSGSTFGDELSTSFLELDKSNKDHFKTQFIDEDELDKPDSGIVDESWTESILDDLDEPDNNRIEPGFSLDDANDEIEANQPPQENNIITEPEFPKLEQKELNALTFQYDQDDEPKKRWIIGSLLFIFNLALLLLLIAQASWFHYEKLAKYPQVASIYEKICAQLDCTLPELSDISKIENRNLVVRSHPTTFKALIIETIITNHASFEQAFPQISLSFSDINNQIIAQRLFTPSEYLNKETLAWTGMPSDLPIQITLEIIDPGSEAVNYKINFHPTNSSSIDQ